jgi:replicative DNA helicase
MQIDLDEYEKIICYKAITDATYLNTIADYVKPEYFENQNIAEYFKIVNDFYDRRKKLPTFTEVKTYLTNDILKNNFRKLLESFKTLDKNFDDDELYENTEKFLKERATWVQMMDIAENAEDKVKNPQKVLEAFDTICNINLVTNNGIEIFRDKDKIIDDILNVESYISSGWQWFDDATGGGFLESGKALYLFGGQANIGKSIFLGNIAVNIAKQGKSVLVISLEMSEMVYAKRMSSNITKIPMKDFKFNTHSLRSLLVEEENRNPEGKVYIKEFPPSTMSPKQIEAFIKKMILSGIKLDAVVIDYIGLLTTSFGSNSYEKGKHICEKVRAMSYPEIFGIPIISAFQLNRQGYGKENPGMDTASESIGVMQTGDVGVSIFQSEEDKELGLIKIGMMRNRYGPMGMVQAMRIEYETLTITQSDEDEEEVMGEEDLSVLERLANQ